MAKTPQKKSTSSRAKSATTRRSAPRKPSSSSKKPPLWRRRWFSLGLKLLLVMVAILGAWGVYLDSKIRYRFDGHKWQLPAVIYGRELSLYPNMRLTRDEVERELKQLNYRKVVHPMSSGEFSVSSSKIAMVRRPFTFPNGRQGAVPVLLTFSPTRLLKIQNRDTGSPLDHLRLDPILIDRISTGSSEDRLFVPLSQIPSTLVQALIQTEDRDFYHHDGISITGIARALIVNVMAGHTVQGGSTLTQQLAKNLFLTQQRTLWRKLQEAYMALLISWRYSKQEVLETYLNEVYLGQNGNRSVHGVGLASYFYFGRPVYDLSLDQQALLVALVKGPSYYDPWRHPQRAIARRDVVLRLMLQAGRLDGATYQQLLHRPLDLVDRGAMGYQRIPGFVEQVRGWLDTHLQNWQSASGLRIFTTLEPIAQRQAQQAVSQRLRAMHQKALQAAMVVTDRHSGAIRALVASRNGDDTGFNRALNARRQVGSLLKPFIYLTAYELGHTPGELLDDSPLSVKLANGQMWQPNNYSRHFGPPVMLYKALAESLNVPTVRLGMALGVNKVIDTLHQAGLMQPLKPYPSLLLGAVGLTPMEVAQIYQTIDGEGVYRPLYSVSAVVDQHDKVIFQHKDMPQRRFASLPIYQVLFNMIQVSRIGTAHSLRWRLPNISIAGKTGTTDDLRDSWFVGADERQIVTTWVGRDDSQPANVTGASAALPIVANYLKANGALSLRPLAPNNLGWLSFSPATGQIVDSHCKGSVLLPVPSSLQGPVHSCSSNALQSFFKKIF
ncbi:penicillin-binding protein 1B [Celerinatantimonas yamalensis]|uniref:Penicillin-binding protein 1B n=1 Tax=Celerinatantimonas yamalensis TaxID=559956 RepID=A0ABW9GB56_9GAMM